MYLLNRLSIQSKLMLMLLIVSIGSLSAISWIAYSSGKDELTTAAFNQLTGLRASRKVQIEEFFKATRISAAHLAEDRNVIAAMHEFSAGFAKFKSARIPAEWDQKLTAFYRDSFLPDLQRNTGLAPRLEAFVPAAPEARYLQYHYIAANPHRQRYKLDDAGDGSAYSASHARLQPVLTRLLRDFGYDNLMLVDSETADVVYTFAKTVALGTNLLDGPYANTAAASLFRGVRKSMYQVDVPVADFEPTLHAAGRPEALMAVPILDGKQIGVLLLEFPVDQIERVMTDSLGWERDGLGKTGEVYLAGPDMTMRSGARLLHEDPEAYYKELAHAGYSPQDVARVRLANSSILVQSVRSRAVQEALTGKEGTAIHPDYLGIPSLVSFAPVNIPGLRWVVVAEIDSAEAFAPLTSLTRKILIWSMVLVLLSTLAASWLGRRFVQPIFRLVDGVRRLREGNKDVSILVDTRDEFADLGGAFNQMSTAVTSMSSRLEKRTRERDDLLDHLLPPAAAERWKRGQEPATDDYPEISVMHAHFIDRGEPGSMTPVRALTLLHDLILALDDAAERRAVEKLSCNGATYMAVCGLSRQRLDHASRIVDFAQDVLKRVNRLNRERQSKLMVQIGIACGPATGGVLGRTRVRYHLTGEPVTASHSLSLRAPCGTILVNRQIYTAVQNLYPFEGPVAPAGGSDSALAWSLKITDSREEALAQAAGAERSTAAPEAGRE